MEVPSPSAGKVASIEVSVGDKVKEGTPIVQLELSGGNGAAPEAETAPAGTVERKTDAQEETAVEAAILDEEQAAPAAPEPPVQTPASPQAGTGEEPAYASPAGRRRARELGVDPPSIRGPGRKARIPKDAVRKPQPKEAASTAAPSGTAVPGLDLAPWPKVDFERYGEVERQPLTRIQKISGP